MSDVDHFTARLASARIRRAADEIGRIADDLFNRRTMGGGTRRGHARRLNAANASLKSADLLLANDDAQKLLVWAVYTEIEGVESLWLAEEDAWKRSDELGGAQFARITGMIVNREWKPDATA